MRAMPATDGGTAAAAMTGPNNPLLGTLPMGGGVGGGKVGGAPPAISTEGGGKIGLNSGNGESMKVRLVTPKGVAVVAGLMVRVATLAATLTVRMRKKTPLMAT